VCVRAAGEVKQSMLPESLWFIVVIILCICALLLLILLIIFLIRYNRGAKYKVFEKEKRHGAKGGRLDEEDQFCEYVRWLVIFSQFLTEFYIHCGAKNCTTLFLQ